MTEPASDRSAPSETGISGRRGSRSARGRIEIDPTVHDDEAPDGPDPTTGTLDLEERSSLRRVPGLTGASTELTDVTEVEYRQLRLERVVLIGVWTQGSAAAADASMVELARLAETAGSEVLDGLVQRRSNPDPGTFVGSGKVAELRETVSANGADTVIADGELSPGQLRQLEEKLKVKVVDRTALILDIFAQHARSREGKAQVELAQLRYFLPRLRGWGESMSRQGGGAGGGGGSGGGGVGTRGPGETKLETDRRRIHQRIAKLRRELEGMKTVRDTQRDRRRRREVPAVAIAGYTNAGKSSLLNAVTDAGVLVEDALFATLDPTTRRWQTPDGRDATLTDTVGFVRHLPHQLVEAFRSTLEEVGDADLVVHVVDGSDPAAIDQIAAVREVIADISPERSGTEAPPELLVVNKVDDADPMALAQLRATLTGAVFVSARTGEGIELLRRRIAEALPRPEVEIDVVLPYTEGALVARVHAEGEVLAERHVAQGTVLQARVRAELAAAVGRASVSADVPVS
ncbi:GTPase HflX [Actinomycetospora sp.]|jgi:GTP-binding protein HflX|uniref:GTPase HflX n=1 Tax=Actinomycetospora sp. TaxID=1872135 RepID=UPI002F4256F1